MKELIDAIIAKYGIGQIDVNPPASDHEISVVEKRIDFSLPTDFKNFYSLYNGFGCCNEYIFNMIPLSEIVQPVEDFGPDWFYFSEYMIYAEVWGMRLTGEGQYVIFNNHYPEFTLSSSLHEFLDRFLHGSVFGPGGFPPGKMRFSLDKTAKEHRSAVLRAVHRDDIETMPSGSRKQSRPHPPPYNIPWWVIHLDKQSAARARMQVSPVHPLSKKYGRFYYRSF